MDEALLTLVLGICAVLALQGLSAFWVWVVMGRLHTTLAVLVERDLALRKVLDRVVRSEGDV